MDVRDRYHSYLVAKKLLKEYKDTSQVLIKAALLHDVGKSMLPYNPLGRIFLHFYAPKNIPKPPHFRGLKGVWQQHIHHPVYGAEMVRAIDSCERLAELIEIHHHPQNDTEAEILHKIDEKF